MTRHTRSSRLTLAVAFALLLSACGSDAGEAIAPVEAVVETTAVLDSTALPEPGETSTEQAAETSAVEVAPPTDGLADASDVTGEMAFEWDPSCSMGPPLNAERADCDTFAGYTILPTTLPATRTGTFDGTETFYGTFAVDADGSYVFAGISSFVGTVEGCGEGTVVFNSAGSGSFDLEQSNGLGTLVAGSMDAISYTAVASELSTLDLAFEATMTMIDPTTFNVTGTLSCGNTAIAPESIGSVRPHSGVTAAAPDWTGPASFTPRITCNAALEPTAPEDCPVVDGFIVQGLDNTLVFGGPLDGDAVFVGTNLISTAADFEHSGILIFDGTVDGCGDGAVVMVNEATGNALRPGFPHLRAFTPPTFDPGPLGVYVDGTASQTGVVSNEMDGSYSC